MSSAGDSSGTKGSRAISVTLPGQPFLRHYSGHQLVTWQPRGTLDDVMLDEIAEWLVDFEALSPPFRRFVDLSQLTSIAVRTRHIFDFARTRAEQYAGSEPARSAVFDDDMVGFGIARMYESLMANTRVQVHAFHDRRSAAAWLGVPIDVLTIQDEPVPDTRGTAAKSI